MSEGRVYEISVCPECGSDDLNTETWKCECGASLSKITEVTRVVLEADLDSLQSERESSERHFTIALRSAQKAQDHAEAERDSLQAWVNEPWVCDKCGHKAGSAEAAAREYARQAADLRTREMALRNERDSLQAEVKWLRQHRTDRKSRAEIERADSLQAEVERLRATLGFYGRQSLNPERTDK